MRCAEIPEQISLYDYGGGTWVQRWRIRRHLARCPHCAQELAVLRRIAEMLPAVPERPVPDRLWEHVWEGLETENARRRQEGKTNMTHRRRKWAPVGAAVATVALAAAGLIWRLGPAPSPAADLFDNPTPFLRYHHLLAQQEVLADAAGLDVLATSGHQRNVTWKQGG